MTALHIRIYEEGSEYHSDQHEDWDLDDFGGVLPSVGDLVVHPGVLEGFDRRQPENRELYEVVARYFQPSTSADQTPRLVLLVRTRKGMSQEVELLGG